MMKQLTRYGESLIATNDQRVKNEMKHAEEKWPSYHPLDRFMIANASINYVPRNIKPMEIFRYKYMNPVAQIEVAATTVLKKEQLEPLKSIDKALDEIGMELDPAIATAGIYHPYQYFKIRENITKLLETFGSNYWDYYCEYLCKRGYEYTTPIMDIAYICEDLARFFLPPLQDMCKVVNASDEKKTLINDIRVRLMPIAKTLRRYDDVICEHFITNGVDDKLVYAHDKAVTYRDDELIKNIDFLYSGMATTMVMSEAIHNYQSPLLIFRWGNPENQIGKNVNNDSKMINALETAKEYMGDAIDAIADSLRKKG